MTAGGDLDGSDAPITLGAGVPCGECGTASTPAPEGNTRYCEACLPVVADRLLRKGTPIVRYRYPEAVFGADDANVRAVKRAAAKAGRTWAPSRKGDDERTAAHRAAVARLVEVLRGTDTARLRYWAGVTMIDGRWCGASGTGAYWAVASRLVNGLAKAELRRRGDAWRAAGLGVFATVEAVRAAGIDEAGRPARHGSREVGVLPRAA